MLLPFQAVDLSLGPAGAVERRHRDPPRILRGLGGTVFLPEEPAPDRFRREDRQRLQGHVQKVLQKGDWGREELMREIQESVRMFLANDESVQI